MHTVSDDHVVRWTSELNLDPVPETSIHFTSAYTIHCGACSRWMAFCSTWFGRRRSTWRAFGACERRKHFREKLCSSYSDFPRTNWLSRKEFSPSDPLLLFSESFVGKVKSDSHSLVLYYMEKGKEKPLLWLLVPLFIIDISTTSSPSPLSVKIDTKERKAIKG